MREERETKRDRESDDMVVSAKVRQRDIETLEHGDTTHRDTQRPTDALVETERQTTQSQRSNHLESRPKSTRNNTKFESDDSIDETESVTWS